MGFFVKACVAGAEGNPGVNAEIDGTTSSTRTTTTSASPSAPTRASSCRWCATPTHVDRRDREEIGRLGRAPATASSRIAEMQGGTFTISNGGVYGSLMSTPILNAPQSASSACTRSRSGRWSSTARSWIRPMMYLALSYDHRIVDGKEAVTFLVRVKEAWKIRARADRAF
jgi:2-oxoglutarate dehydrogenase E2 component (dihydrolipoamide succinyltransferase)